MIDFKIVCFSSRKKSDGSVHVKIKATQQGKVTLLSTGIFIMPEQFEDGQVKDHPNAQRLNAELTRQLLAIQSFALDYIRKNGNISARSLKAYRKNAGKSFVDFGRQIVLNDHNLSHGTKKRYNVVFNHIERFHANIKIEDINPEWLHDFDAYLSKQGLCNNSRAGVHRCIRKILNYAAKLGLINKESVYKYQVKETPSDRSVLTEKEVQKIEDLELKGEFEHLDKVKDLFLFSCYTGLRFGDITALTARNFREGDEGLELHFRAQKTSKLLTVPLEVIFDAKPAKIAQKYLKKIAHAKDMDKALFAKITNQYANRCMKEITLKAGIFKKVTMHVGRHTFATYLASRIPTKLLQELLQHSKIETTMVYVHLSNKNINDALKNAFSKH